MKQVNTCCVFAASHALILNGNVLDSERSVDLSFIELMVGGFARRDRLLGEAENADWFGGYTRNCDRAEL